MSELLGRKKLYTAATAITPDNVVTELNKVLTAHFSNMTDETYLYKYRRGKQPILDRTKPIRSDINYKIVENVADEIVAFKNGYFLTKPTFYVSRRAKGMAGKITKLNDYLYLSGKAEADNNLVDWFHTVGVGVLYIEATGDKEVPVRTYAVDPRQAFVVYSCRPGEEPMMGVNMVTVDSDNVFANVVFDVWTKDAIYHISGGTKSANNVVENEPTAIAANKLESSEVNVIGDIPLIEYTYNRNRMGAFENVLDLCDAINIVQSDRANGVSQFIQSLMVLTNCTLGEDESGNPITAEAIREAGLIELKSNSVEGGAKVDILSEQLDQSQTQVFIDDLMHQICNIAGVPFTNDVSGGTSDNMGAVYLRNGWQTCDTFARNTEDLFRESNKKFDKIFVKILKYATDLDISANDIDIQFTRNEMENLQSKLQAAMMLKQIGGSPEMCFAMFSNDPVGDVARSKKYIDKAFSTESENNEIKGDEEDGTGINANTEEVRQTGNNRD